MVHLVYLVGWGLGFVKRVMVREETAIRPGTKFKLILSLVTFQTTHDILENGSLMEARGISGMY